jgi:hypothetical protein
VAAAAAIWPQNGIGSCQKMRQYNRTTHPGKEDTSSKSRTTTKSLISPSRRYNYTFRALISVQVDSV